ncbi:MAG: hypothetical protein HQL73_08890 [Magnetococcales bacterium]|nr:hypothetical protein [Magnetococcales bacterium]
MKEIIRMDYGESGVITESVRALEALINTPTFQEKIKESKMLVEEYAKKERSACQATPLQRSTLYGEPFRG